MAWTKKQKAEIEALSRQRFGAEVVLVWPDLSEWKDRYPASCQNAELSSQTLSASQLIPAHIRKDDASSPSLPPTVDYLALRLDSAFNQSANCFAALFERMTQ